MSQADTHQDDFQILDNGKPQVISQFEVEPGTAESSAEVSDTDSSTKRYVAIVFDDRHLEGYDLINAKAAAKRYFQSLPPNELAALVTTSPWGPMVDFTNDPTKLLAGLKKVQSKTLGAGVPQFGADYAREALDLVKNLAAAMAYVQGQRTIVLISSGFCIGCISPFWDINFFQELQTHYYSTVEHAIRAHIVINTIEPSEGSLPVYDFYLSEFQPNSVWDLMTSDVLDGLAEETGGLDIRGTNYLGVALRRASAARAYACLLSFVPQHLKHNLKFHTVDVTLKGRDDVMIQARQGYFAPGKKPDESDIAMEVRYAMFSRDLVHGLPVALRLQPGTWKGKPELMVLAHIGLNQLQFRKMKKRNRDVLTCDYGVFDEKGTFLKGTQKIITLKLRDKTLQKYSDSGVDFAANFKIQPGSYIVRLAARDQDIQLVSAETETVTIPPVSADGLKAGTGLLAESGGVKAAALLPN